LLLASLCASGCKQPSTPEKGASFQRPLLRWKQALHVTTAKRVGASLALGTAAGGVALVDNKGKLLWLLNPNTPESRPTSQPTASPVSLPSSRPAVLLRHEGGVKALDVSDDGKRLLSAGGRTIAWWHLGRHRGRLLGRHLRGPHRITTVRFSPDGESAFFGTDQGHVLRWKLVRGEAKAISALSCGARYVDVFRKGLPENERCPYGTYGENKKGNPYCAYPATHLARRGETLARACRTGTLSVSSLTGATIKHYNLSGALADLHFAGDNELLLAREDGFIARYNISTGVEFDARRKGVKEPTSACSAEKMFAIGHSKSITLWHREQQTRLGGVHLPAPAIWIELRNVTDKGGILEALLANGQRLSWPFTLRLRAKGASGVEA